MDTPEVIYLIDIGDEICWCDDESPSGNEEGGVKYIRADIAKAMVLDEKWTSVEDRLPDDMTSDLIVYYENDCAKSVCFCDSYLSSLGFCRFYERELKPIVGVTHWQPRPEPPENEKREI